VIMITGLKKFFSIIAQKAMAALLTWYARKCGNQPKKTIITAVLQFGPGALKLHTKQRLAKHRLASRLVYKPSEAAF
jgi:hypothetical protein